MSDSGRIQFSKMDAVVFGEAASSAVKREVPRTEAKRVFLIASGTLNRETDEVQRIRDALGNRYAGTFAAMPPHTPRKAVIEATNAARDAQADLLLTIGGGSVTDATKAISLCLANDIRNADGIDALRPVPDEDGKPSPPPCNAPAVRQLSIPTTLSGGEFSALSGVTDERSSTKEILRHPDIVPQMVILDPAVTVHTPEWLWLSTGVRAVDHCVEGICSNEANAFGNAQAIQGLALLTEGLPAVKADPSNLDARLKCQMGTWLSMGPLASGVPMGASHGVGYILGAAFDIPHGHTSCVMLPAVMRWNEPANGAAQTIVSAAMGRPGENASDVLREFIQSLDMPGTLSAVNVGTDDFPRIAEQSLSTPWVPRNPRAITSADQVKEILELAR